MNRGHGFAEQLLILNEQRLRWIAPLLVMVIGANTTLTYYTEPSRSWATQPGNLIWFVAALLLWLINLRYGQASRPLPLRRALVLAFASLILALGTARFVSYLHFGIVPVYIICVMVVAMVFLLRPALFLGLFAASFLLFWTVLWMQVLPLETKQMILRSSGSATVFAALLSLILYRSQQAQFAQALAARTANERLRQLNQELERRHQEMNEVMAMTAHDLRSPLFGLKNLLALGVAREDYGADRLRAVMTAGIHASDDLLNLLTRMLEAHEAEQQRRPPTRQQDLRPAFHAAARRAAVLADAKRIRIQLDLPRQRAEVQIHADTLAQVLDNLLSNAVKFSPPDSQIMLQLFEADGLWQAEVRDHGPGIPEREREHLFRKFRRGSAIATGGEPRTGMGLFIAHRRMESMGGSLEYVDRADCGAVFRLCFADSA